MTVREVQDAILKIKKEKNICILAHAYQSQDIWEVADYIGDSFGLSQKATQASADTILMCGVRFMAKTVKILSPEKKVIFSSPFAGCPMAEQMDIDLISQLKATLSDYTIVAYINTTAELKQICDVCVTSSSAVKIIRNINAAPRKSWILPSRVQTVASSSVRRTALLSTCSFAVLRKNLFRFPRTVCAII